MSRIILTDELLKKDAGLSHDRWLRGYDAPEQDEPHEFPPGFYESLLRYADRRRRLKAAFRGAAAAVIALLFAGAILFAASPPAHGNEKLGQRGFWKTYGLSG